MFNSAWNAGEASSSFFFNRVISTSPVLVNTPRRWAVQAPSCNLVENRSLTSSSPLVKNWCGSSLTGSSALPGWMLREAVACPLFRGQPFLPIPLLDDTQHIPKGHVLLDLCRVLGQSPNCLPAWTPVTTEILLHHQSSMSLATCQVDTLPAEFFRAAVEAIGQTNGLQRLQCVHGGINLFCADMYFPRQGNAFVWHRFCLLTDFKFIAHGLSSVWARAGRRRCG